jgi:hypothetical protein
MILILIALAAAVMSAVIATFTTASRDGYYRIPTAY